MVQLRVRIVVNIRIKILEVAEGDSAPPKLIESTWSLVFIQFGSGSTKVDLS